MRLAASEIGSLAKLDHELFQLLVGLLWVNAAEYSFDLLHPHALLVFKVVAVSLAVMSVPSLKKEAR
jgi:hypothetical protein